MNYPITKRKHKYYLCECEEEIKVLYGWDTERYGYLEYMYCPNCCERGERMIAQRGVFEGLAAR